VRERERETGVLNKLLLPVACCLLPAAASYVSG
jgi:hypothetical protein